MSVVLVVMGALPAGAATTAWVPTVAFNANLGTGFNGSVVQALVEQPDGKILVGGDFTTLDGSPAGGLVRLNATGTRDTVFDANLGSGFNGAVSSVAVQPDGKIVVGGSFTSVNGVPAARIARLNADGTVDAAFTGNVSVIANSVQSLAVQPDGKIVAVGATAGAATAGITRLNADGTMDTAFNTNAVGVMPANASGNGVAVQPDGKIVTVGFSNTAKHVFRFNVDGTGDAAFNANTPAFNNNQFAVAIRPTGQILVGGSGFVNGGSTGGMVQLNADGTVDSAFTNVAAGSAYIRVLVPQPDGAYLVGGLITSLGGGGPSGQIALIRADGTRDPSVNPPEFAPTGFTYVAGLIPYADGRILAGGNFTGFAGQTANRLVMIEAITVSVVAPPNQSGPEGTAVSVPVTATVSDASPVSFSATGLPPGLSIDPATGVISGAPTTAGTFTATVSATSRGIVDSSSFTWTITSAPAAPVVDPTDGTSVTGTAEPGATVTVRDPGGVIIGTGTADPVTGAFDIPLSPAQPDGAVLEVTASDTDGNVSPPTAVTVDATAPAAPVVDPTDGTSVSGTAEPGSTVTVRDPNGVTIGTGTADPVTGAFDIPLSPAQPDGTDLTVTATDPAGNVSPPTTVTVDATAPAAPLVDPTNGTQVSGTGEPGDTVIVKDPNGTTIGTGVVAADGSFSIPLSPAQPDGAILSVTQTDPAGNVSPPATVTVDATAPPAPLVDPTNGTQVSGTGEPGDTITVKDPNGTTIGTGTVAPDGSFTIPLSPAQPDGAILSVTQTDPAGNVSPPATVTVDATAPAEPLVDPTDGTHVSGSGEPGGTVTIKDENGTTIGTGTVGPDGSFDVPLNPTQPNGTDLTVTVTDPVGNISPPTTVTVDSAAPAAPVVDPTNGTTVSGTGDPGDTIIVKDSNGTTIGTGTVGPDGTFTIPLNPVQPDGSVLTVTATDPVGNVSPPTTVTVDAVAPSAPMVDPTNGFHVTGTGQPGATVTITDPSGAVVGTGTVGPDGRFDVTLTPAQADKTVLTVTQTDAAGNVSPPADVTVARPAVTPPGSIVCAENANGTVTCSGTGKPGDMVSITDGTGAPVCGTTVTATGTWSCTSSGPVTARPLTITITTPDGDTLTVSGVGVTPYAGSAGGGMGDLASTGSNVASVVVGMLFLLTIGGGLVAIGRQRRRRLQR